MKKRPILNLIVYLCFIQFTLMGCVKKPEIHIPQNDQYFDFKVTTKLKLSLDYGFSNKGYVVLFDVYAENPLTTNEDGRIVKKDIEPIYRAATDGVGKSVNDIQIPTYMDKVWIYSEYPGTLSPVEVKVNNGNIIFNQKEYIQNYAKMSTKGTTPGNRTYPDGWLTLGDWNEYGTPSNLDPERKLPSANLLYAINDIFVKYNKASMKDRFPQFFAAGLSSSVQITKSTKVHLTFINSTAQWNNTVGYFTYPTGQEPQTPEDIQRIMVYPSATPFNKATQNQVVRGALVGGDRVQLKYWDGTQYQDEFPAGVSIGWWLEGMGFHNGDVKIQGAGKLNYSRYSLDHLNADGERRTVSLLDSKSGKIVAVAFEDNIDMKYNDATFYLEVEQEGSIGGGIPTIPDDGSDGPSSEDNYVKTEGFLMFEDLWPSAGDYDMNDVMIKYSSTVYKQIIGNRVYKIVDEFVPYHSGGSLISGFGYQLPISKDLVKNVTIEGSSSQFMEGQMLEPGNSKPTIILFDNVKNMINKNIKVTITLNDVLESDVLPPYNPFIVVETNKGRGKEVHLVKYKPTDKVDATLFGTRDDGSMPEQDLYYVLSKNSGRQQFPFAINIAFIKDFPVPKEGVGIDVTYPNFKGWVKSNGNENKDWYLRPIK